jgi:predicted ATP-grasp superfamily ATP-dependent carboligase
VVIGDLTLVRPLAMATIDAVVVVTDPDDIVLSSRHVARHLVVPGMRGAAEDESLALLVRLSERLRDDESCERPPLFYGSDAGLDFVRRHRSELEPHYRFLCNDDLLLARLLDKSQFAGLAAERGIAVPASLDSDDSEAGFAALRPPLLVKPKRKLDWKPLQRALFDGVGKAQVFDSAHDLCDSPAFQRHRHDLVVQEYIPSDEVLSYHAFVDDQGNELASFCGRKIRAFPLVTGESACVELLWEPDLMAFGRRAVERLGLVGPCKLDIVRDRRDGALYLLEVNARYNLWHYLGAVHGINLMQVAYDYLIHGIAADAHDYQPHARWLNLYRDYLAFRTLRRQHAMTCGEWLAQLAREPNIYEAFAWDDPLPALRWFMRQLGEKVRGTVGSKVRRWHAMA